MGRCGILLDNLFVGGDAVREARLPGRRPPCSAAQSAALSRPCINATRSSSEVQFSSVQARLRHAGLVRAGAGLTEEREPRAA